MSLLDVRTQRRCPTESTPTLLLKPLHSVYFWVLLKSVGRTSPVQGDFSHIKYTHSCKEIVLCMKIVLAKPRLEL